MTTCLASGPQGESKASCRLYLVEELPKRRNAETSLEVEEGGRTAEKKEAEADGGSRTSCCRHLPSFVALARIKSLGGMTGKAI